MSELPDEDAEIDGETRRDFLRLLGLTALAGAAGCARRGDEARPYVKQPPGVTPGIAQHYATTLTLDGFGLGVVVESREGRPTKVEGNPDHPASLGSTSVFEQAAVYQLYDPQRARTSKLAGRPRAWSQVQAALRATAGGLVRDAGAGLRFLIEPTGSPLERELLSRLIDRFPRARVHGCAAVPHDPVYDGTHVAFGRPLEPQLDLERARVIVSLDADLFTHGGFRVRYQRQFANHRVPENELNRLYVAEPGFTVTGASADHRLALAASEMEALAAALLWRLAPTRVPHASPYADHPWVRAAASDLSRRGAASVVVAGDRQPARVHAMVHAINQVLGSESVRYTAPILGSSEPLADLVEEMRAGTVHTLVITAYNPVYTAPPQLGLAEALSKVTSVIYRGLFEDETARHATWFVPAAHPLESWGDARALDGTASLIQPLIAPLHGGVSSAELWSLFLDEPTRGAQSLLSDSWRRRLGRSAFDQQWLEALRRGVVAGTALATESTTLSWDRIAAAASAVRAARPLELELTFRLDSRVYDGRFADTAWLQELPDPLSKLTWGNALEISPETARRLSIATEDLLELTVESRVVRVPALVMPGHADDSVSLSLGYGRSGAELVARDVGTSGYPLRGSDTPGWVRGVSVTRTGRKVSLAITQDHHTMQGRPIALDVTVAQLGLRHLPVLESQQAAHPSVYPPVKMGSPRWGMTIDLSRCTGCNACAIACASENNILVVGKDEVRRGREMWWLRIDRYFTGDQRAPQVMTQPMMCVHCENAPCEYVCPVNATVHSDEGLNEMVYNRCIGTRYCSNNCPYKVRRFNFFDYQARLAPSEQLAMNPDVTVRARGVMEKCTYCVQRIERARIDSRVEHRAIRDQEFTTACAQVCPSRAIVFGATDDPTSQVARLQRDRRAYRVLAEANTRPRTLHLARVRNPNPDLG
jgi:Fe-S-cluster-containing dehydrogenase component